MADMSLEDIYSAARRLSPAEQEELIKRLRASGPSQRLTRHMIINEFRQRVAAGKFEGVESLLNKYADPNVVDISDEELRREIREASSQWKQDVDEL